MDPYRRDDFVYVPGPAEHLGGHGEEPSYSRKRRYDDIRDPNQEDNAAKRRKEVCYNCGGNSR